MIADIKIARGARGRWGWAVAADHKVDTEELICVPNNSLGKGEVEPDTDYGEHEAEWEPHVSEDGIEWVGALHEAPVMEYDSTLEAVYRDRFGRFVCWYHVSFLQSEVIMLDLVGSIVNK